MSPMLVPCLQPVRTGDKSPAHAHVPLVGSSWLMLIEDVE